MNGRNTVTPGRGAKTRRLLYGAYEYTGRLAAEPAASRELDVVHAGRNKGALAGLGDRLSLPWGRNTAIAWSG